MSQIIVLNNVEVNKFQTLAEEGNAPLEGVQVESRWFIKLCPQLHILTRVPSPTQPPCLHGDQVDWRTAWADFSGWLLIFIFLHLCGIFVKNHYCYLILAAVRIQCLLNRKYYPVANTMCHYSSGNKVGSKKILLILGKMVRCDQSRGQCSDTAKSAHHLSIPWLACTSFFLKVFSSQNLFLPFISVGVYKTKQFLISTLI